MKSRQDTWICFQIYGTVGLVQLILFSQIYLMQFIGIILFICVIRHSFCVTIWQVSAKSEDQSMHAEYLHAFLPCKNILSDIVVVCVFWSCGVVSSQGHRRKLSVWQGNRCCLHLQTSRRTLSVLSVILATYSALKVPRWCTPNNEKKKC